MKRFITLMAIGLLANSAMAAVIVEVGSPMGTVQVSSDDVGQVTTDPGTGTITWTGSMTNMTLGWGLDWNFDINTDPFINGVATFTSMMPATANFTFNISTSSADTIVAPTVRGFSSISVGDINGDGATMGATSGSSIYEAFIDATTEHLAFSDPYSLVAAPNSGNVDLDNWGPQTALIPSINTGDTFGMNHAFSLTSMDQATINSAFFITPEPASLVLLTLAGVLIRRR